MTPPRHDPLEEARRRLDAAAGALDEFRRLTGAGEASESPLVPAADSVRREALAAARDVLHGVSAELEAERVKSAGLLEELGRLREELSTRPTERDIKEAQSSDETDAARRAAELTLQVSGLKERVSLLNAEHVRLEALRRRAEASVGNSEASRRSTEEVLRRDLLAANSALDRAAAESGVRDAKAVSEVEALRKRLDNALGRLQREVEPSLRVDFEAAQAVIASLRRELAQQRAESLSRERAFEKQVHELERRPIEKPFPPPVAGEFDDGSGEEAGV